MLNGSLFVMVLLVAVIAGIVIGFVLKQLFAAKKIKSSESLAARIVEESKKEAETIKGFSFYMLNLYCSLLANIFSVSRDFDARIGSKITPAT